MKRSAALSVVLTAAFAAAPLSAAPQPWKRVITEPDRQRLAGLWRAWTTARSQVAAAGRSGAWAAQGPLTDPGAATADGPPPPGEYRCRAVKLGTQTPGMPVMAADAPTPCRIEAVGDDLRFVRDGSAQRTAGVLYPDGDRLVYLGALSLGGEVGRFKYNADPDRSQVGVMRAIGPRRWRLELPFPRWESTLDVIEVVPVG